MKHLLLVLLSMIISGATAYSQELAITENKDTVYLYPNGTWSYQLEDGGLNNFTEFDFLDVDIKLDTIQKAQKFSKDAKAVLKSKLDFFEVKYDATKWNRVPPAQYNEEAEFALLNKGKEIYCIIISEEIEVGFENLPKIAMNTMKENTGAEIDLKKTELRNVNGKEIIRGVYDMELSGMKITFDTYFYSSEKGSIQFTTYTGTNVWNKYEEDILDFLNGIVIY